MSSYTKTFSVVQTGDRPRRTFAPDATYKLHDSGVLEITPPDEEPIFFGPTGWQRMEPMQEYDLRDSMNR
jgi:hypothetical protein